MSLSTDRMTVDSTSATLGPYLASIIFGMSQQPFPISQPAEPEAVSAYCVGTDETAAVSVAFVSEAAPPSDAAFLALAVAIVRDQQDLDADIDSIVALNFGNYLG